MLSHWYRIRRRTPTHQRETIACSKALVIPWVRPRELSSINSVTVLGHGRGGKLLVV